MQQKRIESLDILRGADMFLLTTLGPVVMMLAGHSDSGILAQFRHVDWVGFSMWDLIMPLFMFLAGVTIPFSMAKYVGDGPLHSPTQNKAQAWVRILRRVLALWVLGMVAQGNLLKFDWSVLKFYSNTLQAIAAGYLVCAVLYLYCQKPSVHIGTGIILLLAYWAAMTFIRIEGHGGADFTPDGNLAEYIDISILGSHRDGYVGSGYHYTWILSSLTFAGTVMMGMLSGEVLRGKCRNKALILIVSGLVCAAAGWLWGMQMPVIKKLWTSSMVLVAGGYSMILLGFSHLVVDRTERGGKIFGWLKIYGQNAIVAYMVMECGYLLSLNTWVNVASVIVVLLFCHWKKWHLKV